MGPPPSYEPWPQDQAILPVGDPMIGLTHFKDASSFNASLTQKILRLEQDSKFKHWIAKGGCGMKIHHVPHWEIPEATMLHERAMALFKRMLKVDRAVVDDSWCSIYRKGDYCMAHSHLRAQASIVYMLEEGEPNAEDKAAGKFCIADPRLAACCKHEPGRMTYIIMPDMKPGSMIIFPGSVVHSVNPYMGSKPRITLSWNINVDALPGRADEIFKKKSN